MDLLILLVGTNPLPNWVTFDYLHRDAPVHLKPQKVLLIHSERTAPQASRLQRKIHTSDVDAQLCPIGKDAGDARKIRDAVRKSIVEAKASTVHLDYTGGTKQMVVQAYAAVRDLEGEKKLVESRFSYLDATSHRLRFDNGDREPVGGSDLRGRVTVSLDVLVALHGSVLKSNNKDGLDEAPQWPQTTEAIWESMSSEDGRRAAYMQWREPFALARTNKDYKELPKNAPIALPTGMLQPIGDAVITELQLTADTQNFDWQQVYALFGATTSDQRLSAIKKTAKFFDGIWLEGHLWHLLAERTNGLVQTPHWSVKAVREGSSVDSELDVVLLIGYQLFLFSCTTSRERSLVKSKAFEAIHRAKQFGGDAARPILVTLLPPEATNQGASVDSIREDIETDVGHGEGPRVWGMHDLQNFDETWQRLRMEEGLP